MTGYRKKPAIIVVISLLYLLNPILNFIFLFSLNTQFSIIDILSIFKILLLAGNIRLILLILFWLSAIPLVIGLFNVSLWAWYYFMVHSTGMFVLSLFGTGHFHFTYASLVNLIFMVPISFLLSNKIRVPYFNPKLRWWRQSKRFLIELQLKIGDKECSTYDFSEDGAFIINDDNSRLKTGDTFPVEIDLKSFPILCRANVRWINNHAGNYPKGYGILFEKFRVREKQMIRRYIRYLVRNGIRETR